MYINICMCCISEFAVYRASAHWHAILI